MFELIIFSFFALILFAANLADVRRQAGKNADLAKLASYGTMILIQLSILLAGIGGQIFALLLNSEMGDEIQAEVVAADGGIDLATVNFNLISAGMWVPALIGLLVMLPPVRRQIGRLIPINPASAVHAISLSMATFIIPNLALTMGIGLDNLAEMLSSLEESATDLIFSSWMQALGFLLMGFIGVGWLTHRSFSETLQRLKLTRISLRELFIGIGFAIVALALIFAAEPLIDYLGLGNADVDALSEELYGPFFNSIFGILTIGLAASLGEETIFRGAMQPRFGRLLTALIFALLHSNYGLSTVTLIIFFVGLLLGYVRDRYSTTTAMVTHATYNSAQGILIWLFMTYDFGI